MKPKFASAAWRALSFAILGAIYSGCVTVKDTVYLNSIDVSGPIQQPPIHLTNKPAAGEVHITPRLSINQNRSVDSRVSENVYPVVADSVGENFHWSIPTAQFGLDFDWMMTGGLALNLGVSYASTDRTDSWGGNVGLGLPFDGQGISGRFEAGLYWQSLWYDAHSVLVHQGTYLFSSDTYTDVIYYHDIDRSTPVNAYATLTLNGTGGSLINGFVSVSVNRQTFASFQPSRVDVIGPFVEYHYSDERATQAATFIHLTPGFAFTMSPRVQLLTGVRFSAAVDGLGDKQPLFVAPMMQVGVKM